MIFFSEPEYAGFLTGLQMSAAAPIQQTERNGIKLVAACINEGMLASVSFFPNPVQCNLVEWCAPW